MAISLTVYSPSYPNNTKTVTIDLVSRVPLGAEGDEKYILYVYTTAYSNNTNRTAIDPIYMYAMRRGWAQGFIISSPFTTTGGTLTVAVDEDPAGAVELTIASGTTALSVVASNLQSALRLTASGVKASSSNVLGYLNSAVQYVDGRLTFLSGSTKNSFNSSSWSETSSVKVTGGTLANALGFGTGYPNSYDLAATVSGTLIGPASAHVTFDDAISFAVSSLVNQIDFTS
jgi:hypothetical protein